MKPCKKRLTLSTPYCTLLNHVWAFKKSTSELDKQNTQLKSKILCRVNNSLNKRRSSKAKEPRETTMAAIDPDKSHDLLRKLDALKKHNDDLLRELGEREEEKREVTQDMAKLAKLQAKIKRAERALHSNIRKIKKQARLSNKRTEISKSHKFQGATREVILEQIEREERKYCELSRRIEQYNAEIGNICCAESRLGRQIIELIEEKNELRRELRSGKGSENI